MKNKSSLSSANAGFFTELWQQGRLAVSLLLDRQVPIYLKLLPVAAIAYLLFPLDFLPDLVPGLGQLDDLTILILGTKMFIDMAPQDIVQRYLQQFAGGGKAYEGPVVVDADKAKKAADEAADANVVEGILINDDETK